MSALPRAAIPFAYEHADVPPGMSLRDWRRPERRLRRRRLVRVRRRLTGRAAS